MLSSTLQGADKIYSLGCVAPPCHSRHILGKLHNQPERAGGEEKEKRKKCPEDSKKPQPLSVCQATVVYKTGMPRIALLETS